LLASIPRRTHLGPSAEDVDHRQAPEEASAHVSSAVSDGIRLDPAGLGRVPGLRMDRDERFDRGVGFRGAPIDLPSPDLFRSKDPVNLGSTDRQ
jgi:hypothetical protein